MPSPEKASFSILVDAKQDSVMGIAYNNPQLRRSYWKELLQKQIDCDGKRNLGLLIVYPGKASEIRIFEDLRMKAQNLSDQERNDFLSKIIEQIYQAKQIFLVETNEEKYIPIPSSPDVRAEPGLNSSKYSLRINDHSITEAFMTQQLTEEELERLLEKQAEDIGPKTITVQNDWGNISVSKIDPAVDEELIRTAKISDRIIIEHMFSEDFTFS